MLRIKLEVKRQGQDMIKQGQRYLCQVEDMWCMVSSLGQKFNVKFESSVWRVKPKSC